MKMKRFCAVSVLLLLLAANGAALAARAKCIASSGPTRAALLELYTSEGCNSCPPADRRLSDLRERAPREVVPLAFHVDYWNRLGWIDRFSRPAWSERQGRIAARHRSSTVYTPQFVLNGQNWRDWRGGLPEPGAERAVASLRLRLQAVAKGRLEVSGEARIREAKAGAQVTLVLYENGLTSRIVAGENAGSLLKHDFVVRQLLGPFPLPETGRLRLREAFALEAEWKRENLGVSAFIDHAETGEVYQALRLHMCKRR